MRFFESLGGYKSQFVVLIFWSTFIGFILGLLRGVAYVEAHKLLGHKMYYLSLSWVSWIISKYLLIALGVGISTLLVLLAIQAFLKSVSANVKLNNLIVLGGVPSLLVFIVGVYWLNKFYLPSSFTVKSILGNTIWALACAVTGWLILKAIRTKFYTCPRIYNLKSFVTIVFLVVVLNAGSYFLSLDSKRPNLILISIDTLRADHLGCYGYDRNTTPTIDRLAKDGVLFANTIAQSSWTLPSHMSLLTGLYSSSHGVIVNPIKLANEHVTIAEVLQNAGYETAAITDGGYLSPRYGYQGFNFFDTNDAGFKERRIEGTYDIYTEWLRKKHGRPFFLFLHTYQVHAPFDPPPRFDLYSDKNYGGIIEVSGTNNEYYKKIQSKMSKKDYLYVIDKYDGEINYTDHYLGKLFKELKDLGLYDRTIIILTSDHGEHFLDHPDARISFIGHFAHQLYDEIVKVPLIIKAPGFPKKQIIDAQVESIDIMPTVLELLEIPIPSGLDGQSLVSLVNINKGSHLGKNYAFSEKFSPTSKSRDGEYSMIRSTNWKLLLRGGNDSKASEMELYNLKADSKEQNNLFRQEVEIGKSLFAELQAWMDIQRGKSKFAPADKIELDENLKEQLKALGYMN